MTKTITAQMLAKMRNGVRIPPSERVFTQDDAGRWSGAEEGQMTTPIAQGPVDVNVSRHCCDLTKHPFEGYGEAISYCEEREDGTLWVGNSEYGTQVNFCPACGFPAKVKVTANLER